MPVNQIGTVIVKLCPVLCYSYIECITEIDVKSNIALHELCFMSKASSHYLNGSDTAIWSYMRLQQVAVLKNTGSLAPRILSTLPGNCCPSCSHQFKSSMYQPSTLKVFFIFYGGIHDWPKYIESTTKHLAAGFLLGLICQEPTYVEAKRWRTYHWSAGVVAASHLNYNLLNLVICWIILELIWSNYLLGWCI